MKQYKIYSNGEQFKVRSNKESFVIGHDNKVWFTITNISWNEDGTVTGHYKFNNLNGRMLSNLQRGSLRLGYNRHMRGYEITHNRGWKKTRTCSVDRKCYFIFQDTEGDFLINKPALLRNIDRKPMSGHYPPFMNVNLVIYLEQPGNTSHIIYQFKDEHTLTY